jgi:NAD(P)-dependent dehydrogenase (short-subunit alcohol dehydrogenase family)
VEEHARVDILVNNVSAVRLRLEGFLGTSDEEFEWALQMNFFTALRAPRAVLPAVLVAVAHRHCRVVNAFFQADAGTIDSAPR